MEILSSSYSAGGERLYLLYRLPTQRYRRAPRWCYVAMFRDLQDAIDGFETLQLSERPAARLGRLLIIAVRITRRRRPAERPLAMLRVNLVLDYIEARTTRAGP